MSDLPPSRDKRNESEKAVQCDECCALIPRSSGKGLSAEVEDYVYEFCGATCFQAWKQHKTGVRHRHQRRPEGQFGLKPSSLKEIEREAIFATLEVGYTDKNPKDLQKASLYVYRSLAEGRPVSFAAVADHLGTPLEAAETILKLVPASAIELDDNGDIVGFVGLSIVPSTHRFKTARRSLFTWCVFDALFLPALIGSAATLHTACPQTGREIEIRVDGTHLTAISPDQPVMSLAKTDTEACCQDLRGAFCDRVNMFASQAAFDHWSSTRPDAISVSLPQAFELAQQRNSWRYPEIEY